MRARQATGELAGGLDLASVRLAIMRAVMIPVVMPQLVRRVFGFGPTDPAFEARSARRFGPSSVRLGIGGLDSGSGD